MFRMIQSKSVQAAKSYYARDATSRYYAGSHQELIGSWGGKGAERLGLRGTVDKRAADALAENRHPRTGERLTCRQRKDRTVGYDLNFHAVKSVSILYAITQDPDILQAFRWAVDATMRQLEGAVQTRVRKGGSMEDRNAGNLVWAEYVHFTARPVDGVPDPHLHSHCFVYNCVYDPVEERWKAGKFRDIKQNAPRYQAEFQRRFAGRLAELGYPVIRKGNAFEIAGIDRELIEKFSRRTLHIEQEAKRRGIVSDRLKDSLGAQTRQPKRKDDSMERLRTLWNRRLTDRDRAGLAVATARRRFTAKDPSAIPLPYGSMTPADYQATTARNIVRRMPADKLPPGLAERQRRSMGMRQRRQDDQERHHLIPDPLPDARHTHGR